MPTTTLERLPEETKHIHRKGIREHMKVENTRHRSRSKHSPQTLCNRNPKSNLLQKTQRRVWQTQTNPNSMTGKKRKANNRPINAQPTGETKQIPKMDSRKGTLDTGRLDTDDHPKETGRHCATRHTSNPTRSSPKPMSPGVPELNELGRKQTN